LFPFRTEGRRRENTTESGALRVSRGGREVRRAPRARESEGRERERENERERERERERASARGRAGGGEGALYTLKEISRTKGPAAAASRMLYSVGALNGVYAI
jgi:hypothetical protein